MALYSTEREVIETAIAWLEQGYRPLLVTVARTWGSSPRPPGSLMLMRDDGRCCGSVSGGCVEQDLVARYTGGQLAEGFPMLVDYGIDRSEATRLGLPCNGRLELLIEALDSAQPFRQLLRSIQEHRPVTRRVCLRTGEASLHAAGPAGAFSYDARTLAKTFGPDWLMLLIGTGQLSGYVAQIALTLDYRVIVCDPRRDNAHAGAPQGCERIYDMPDDAVRERIVHPRCAVIALTHDPKLDDMALLQALESPAFYIGAIGSRRNCEKRRERLRTLGVSQAGLERLHAPVGLPIGSHSPPEIAVSILAQITALRHARRQSQQRDASAA